MFVVFACAWIGLNVHCGWVRYHEFLGNIAFNKVHLPDELALAQLDPARWLSSGGSGKHYSRKRPLSGGFENGFVCKQRSSSEARLV